MLPIDEALPAIVRAVEQGPAVVVEAAPGAGKTTRIPPALLGIGGEVLVLEPRRIAARMAARRVAREMGEEPGGTVGYQVRFEDVSGPRTRLKFLTEGVLTRRLLGDGGLAGVGVVCLDEFHERHLEGDMALALLRRLQRTRPELRLVVMSATLEADALADYLGGCPVIRSRGRAHEVTIEHTPYSARPLEEQVASAVARAMTGESEGDALVFLPGAAEIQRALRAVEPWAAARGVEVAMLHGDLPAVEQDRAVTPGPRRKVILATNVAESSITVEGVRVVIDSGLARVAGDSPWSGLPTLKVARVSQASARQRAGRAGRTGPGRVIRLYTLEDFQRRAASETPEIRRRELSRLCLDLAAMGIAEADGLEWLDAPPPEALEAARGVLRELGAVTDHGGLTALGAKMARLPLAPRLGRMVVEGVRRGAGEAAGRAAAWLSGRERAGTPDLLALVEREPPPQIRRAYEQLRRQWEKGESGSARRGQETDEALKEAVLRAFPDRVAARRTAEGLYAMAQGGQVRVIERDAPPLLVALEVEDRTERAEPLVRLYCPIEPELLIDEMTSVEKLEWNGAAERVEAVSSLVYRKLTIEENRTPAPLSEAASEMLFEQARQQPQERFTGEEGRELMARIRFAAAQGSVRAAEEDDARGALRALCTGRRSFAELEAASGEWRLQVERRAGPRLAEAAPTRLRLAGGRTVAVHYQDGKAPWVASRLQDFFGMRETPRVGGGVPLVVHLLAPNQRPVQTTSDLRGFWERLYPKLRRELGRRYPKHAWPEDPMNPLVERPRSGR